MTRLLKVVIAACLAAVTPIVAHGAPTAAAPPPVETGDRVTVPFAPPIGRPLRYRLDRSVTKSAGQTRVWSVIEIGFSQRDEGYRMEVRTVDAGMEHAEAVAQRAFREATLHLQLPYALLLDQSGAIEGLENEEAYWAELLRLTEGFLREARAPRETSDQAGLAFAMDIIRDTTSEGRLNILTQYISPIVEFGDTEHEIGEEVSTRIEVAGLMGLTLDQDIGIKAERVEGGLLFVAVRGSIPQEELNRAIAAFVARIRITGRGENTESGRERLRDQLSRGRISRDIHSRYEVALDTGLTRRMISSDRVETSFEAETTVRVTEIQLERID